jgi:hypothetical protein
MTLAASLSHERKEKSTKREKKVVLVLAIILPSTVKVVVLEVVVEVLAVPQVEV